MKVTIKTLALFVFGAILGLVVCPEGLRSEEGPKAKPAAVVAPLARIEQDEARSLFDRGEVVFLDARAGTDFEREHIPGSLALVDREGHSLIVRLRPWLGRDLPFIIMGGAANDARPYAKAGVLRMMGYRNVRVFDGGLAAWKRSGGPTVTGWDMGPMIEEARR